MSMRRTQFSETDRAAVHADLRKRFGPTVTRQQLFDYRDETGVYPVWLRRESKYRVGRGTYAVPEPPGAPAVPFVAPPKAARKLPPAPSNDAENRSVLASPFDDDTYDRVGVPEPAESEPPAATAAVAVVGRRGRKPRVDTSVLPDQVWEYYHAYVCKTNPRHALLPENTRPEVAQCPTCGGAMDRRFWSKKF